MFFARRLRRFCLLQQVLKNISPARIQKPTESRNFRGKMTEMRKREEAICATKADVFSFFEVRMT